MIEALNTICCSPTTIPAIPREMKSHHISKSTGLKLSVNTALHWSLSTCLVWILSQKGSYLGCYSTLFTFWKKFDTVLTDKKLTKNRKHAFQWSLYEYLSSSWILGYNSASLSNDFCEFDNSILKDIIMHQFFSTLKILL